MKLKLRVTSLILTLFFIQSLFVNMPVKALENAADSVTFADSALESAVRDKLQKPTGTITVSDMGTIYDLDLSSASIKNISGLEYAVNLTELSAESNYIEDLSPLQNLTKLNYLNLTDNYISSVDALKNLTNLEVLGLYANLVSDVSSLSALTKLKVLDLGYNLISDISKISGLTKLEVLSLTANSVSDLEPLKNMTSLQYLDLQNNDITDISVLNTLKTKGAFSEAGSTIGLDYNFLYLLYASQQAKYVTNLRGGGTEVIVDHMLDSTAPRVIFSDPSSWDQGFPANLPLTVQFDKAVMAGSYIDDISIVGDEGKIISTKAAIDNDKVIITPDEKLVAGERYILQVPLGAVGSRVGGSMSNDFTAVFYTTTDAINKFTVTFASNGGSEVPVQSVFESRRAVKPADPTKGGYKFGGWYTDQYPFTKLFDFSQPLTTGNVTLYARWVPTEAYIISYLQQTKDTKLFGIYNQAKAVIYESDLSEVKKGYYLGQLAQYDKVVFTDINKYFINRCIDIAASPNLTDFLALVDEIDAKLTNDIDKGYFKGQMDSWGRYRVYTPEVQASIDAIVQVWTLKTPESVDTAKAAIAKVKEPGSVTWLNDRLDEAVQAMSK